MTSYSIQAGALRTNPNSGPLGVGVQAEIAYTLEARAEVQAVLPDNDNRPIAVASNAALKNGTRFLSVCSGIGAASQVWPQWQAVAFSEIEKFPSAVLAHHYPDVPNLGDFTKIDTTKLGRVDIFCGGTPCQAFSVAGLRQSLADERGNLSLEFVRLAHELANGNGLRNVVWENVPGVLSTKDNAFGCFLAGLVGDDTPLLPPNGKRWPNAGLVAGPKGRAAWRILDAQYFGLAQRRRRVIVVADFGIGADPAAVLFEPESLPRHSPPSREAGEGTIHAVAPSLVGSGRGVGRTGDTRGQDPVVACFGSSGDGYWRQGIGPLRAREQDSHESLAVYAPEIARCDATREGSSQDYETTTMVAVSVTGQIAHTFKAEGADASEDGTGRGTPIVCVHGTQDPCVSENTAFALGRNSGGENVIAFTAKDYGGDAAYDISLTLRAGGHGGSHANAGVMPAVAFHENQRSEVSFSDTAGTLGVGGGKPGQGYPAALTGSAVRRLTPVECERLQGFPDNYTRIPWRGKPAEECPDGPRYKALGNSWAVPLFAWLGRRIDAHMPPLAAHNDNKDSHLDAA